MPPQGGRKHPQQEFLQVDTSDILFICGGAFAGLDKVIRARTERSGIGFGAELHSQFARESHDILELVQPEDLIQYGLIPEFVGRLPMVAVLEELDEEMLVRVLLEPKNAITRQYRKLFSMEGVTLEFLDDALNAVARLARERKTGARGLRTILETVLLDAMYELPSLEGVAQIVVDEAVILGEKSPVLIYEESAAKKKRA